MDALNQAAPAAIGAVAGGGGVLWIAKLLLGRMIEQYDKRHDDHQNKLERLAAQLADSEKTVAVLLAMFNDAKTLRVEMQALVSKLQGELETKHISTVEQVADLRADVFVAHERIRLLATGDEDITKVQKPNNIKRR